ncbi:MAG: TrkH family potassium uptake protein [Metamycoplasmataceae bacterium]
MNKIKNFFSYIWHKSRKLSNFKIILIVYFLIVVISSVLLFSPFSQTGKVAVSYVDALFTASSAFSDTGLVSLVTAETWSIFGQFLIAMLIFIGGVGIFALKYYIFNFILRRGMSLMSRNILDKERSSKNLGISFKTIKISITIMFVLAFFSSFILSFIFYFGEGNFSPSSGAINNPQGNLELSIRMAIFHSVSALNNAGFDIIGSTSLVPYYYNVTIQIIFIILFVIGGIGFPVLYDLYIYFENKIFKKSETFKFSLFTKISSLAYIVIAISGIGLTFIFELTNNSSFWYMDKYGNEGYKTMAIIFNTMSTRNAGFATIHLGDLSEGSIVAYSIMMFIGSAPSSTAGGIRTTTIAIIFLGIWNRIKNSPSVKVFGKKINPVIVTRANVVFAISMIIVMFTSLVCYSSVIEYQNNNPNELGTFSYLDIFFEVSSAFGTTGLSTGLTSHLNVVSKILLIFVMFIGQLGISSSILVWNENKRKQELFDFVEEDILIG